MDSAAVRSGRIPVRLTCQVGHICIAHSALPAAVFTHLFRVPHPDAFHLPPSVPPQLIALLPLSFPGMYIFRSWVIKPAPEGMCWNRISLILPCPQCIHIQIHTSTRMIVSTRAHTKAELSFLHSVYLKHLIIVKKKSNAHCSIQYDIMRHISGFF